MFFYEDLYIVRHLLHTSVVPSLVLHPRQDDDPDLVLHVARDTTYVNVQVPFLSA